MSTDTRLNITPQLVLGTLMIVFGVLLTLDRMELVDAARTLRFWPVVLIGLGSWLVIERGPGGRSFPGYAMIIFGSLLLLNSLGIARVRFWELFWPALIILVGARLVVQRSWHRGSRREFHTSAAGQLDGSTASAAREGTVNMFSVMGSHQRASTDKPFRGGEVTTIVGGTQLDLRQAEIAPGDEAVVNVFVFMGGHEVWVPQGWTVVNDVMPVLGGVEDKRLPPVVNATSSPTAVAGTAPRVAWRRRAGRARNQELMHPILEDRRRLALYLLAWLLVGMLLTVGLRSDAAWTASAAFLVPLSLVYAFIGLSTWYLCRAFPLSGTASVWTLIVVQITAAATASAIWTSLGYVWAGALDGLLGEPAAQPFYTQQRPLLFVVGALLYWLAAAGHYMLIAFQSSRDAETRAFEQTLLAREAELRALRAQIDPHFIFNSLHSISALTTTDAAAARTMCLLLADFLRDTLRLGSSTRISFADEWSLAERFLAIEQVRLGSRLNVTRQNDPEAAECPVPPLLLQPLVENAVIHGIAQMVEGGTITMTAHREGPTLTVTVENPCDPDRLRTRGVGLGLELLRQRLTTEFGVYDAVRAEEQSGRFKVVVRIPVAAPQTA